MGRGGGLDEEGRRIRWDGKGIRCPHDSNLSDPRGPLVRCNADCRGIDGEGWGRRAESADCRIPLPLISC